MTREQCDYEHMIMVKKTKRSIVWGKIVFVCVVFTAVVWIAIMSKLVFFPNEPAKFIRAEILTPVVIPTGDSVFARSMGSVRIRAWVESKLEPSCLVSTQFFIEFRDGSLAKTPGMRITTKGDIKEVLYEGAVPVGSPLGEAQFYISDTYNCSLQAQRIDSPHLRFIIGDGANG